jgi:hypothetical protein
MHMQAASTPQDLEYSGVASSTGASLMEVSVFVAEQLKEQLKEQRDHDEKIRKEMEAKLEAQKEETEVQRQEAEAYKKVAAAKVCVSEAQPEALQARLDALHQAELLTDDEVYTLEDCVADFIGCRSSATVAAAEMGAAAEKAKKLVGLSEGVAKDGMLARQLRRKFA